VTPEGFGSVLWHPKTDGPVEDHPLLSKLGIEPFDAKFDAQWLKQGLAGRKVSIKQALLAGDVVVGAGNIYASESLFRARIHPKTQASRVSLARCERLVEALKSTLTDALQSGAVRCATTSMPQGKLGRISRYMQPSTNVRASHAESAARRSNGSCKDSAPHIFVQAARKSRLASLN